MPGAEGDQVAGGRREQGIEDGHEGAPGAGAAERAVEQRGHPRRVGVEIERRLQGGIGDGHHQAGGHAVPGGVADHQRRPPVGQPQHLVVVAAHLVGGAVGMGEAVSRQLDGAVRQQLGLQLARHLQLVANPHAVDQLESQQEDQAAGGQHEPERREIDADVDGPAMHDGAVGIGASHQRHHQADQR